MSDKPKIAIYWCASCGGCEEAVVDLAEKVLDVVAAVDIIFWPVALDFKRKDVEAMADGSILATFLNGGVRNSEQREMVHMLRKKSQLMVAFGACSQLGGIPGLGNMWDRESIFRNSYQGNRSVVNPDYTTPQTHPKMNGHDLELPVFYDTLNPLDLEVEVDYYIPGCAPTPKIIFEAVTTLLSGNLPPKGTVLAPDKALCDECPRKETKPESMMLKEFHRPHQIKIDEEKCLLAQGLLCMGPSTRAGCEALCIKGNMPCTGCFGPTTRVRDHGAKALSGFASLVDSNDEGEIKKILESIPDPIGTVYRYGLAASLLRRKRMEGANVQ